MAEFEIQGLQQLHETLQTLPAKIETNVLRGAVRAGQRVIMLKAKALAPKKTQALAKSIRVKASAQALKRGVVRADVVAGDATAWYAHLIEFGTGSHYEGTGTKSQRKPYVIKPKKRSGKGRGFLRIGGAYMAQVIHPGIRAQPFMRPAAELLEGPALNAFVAYVQKRLPKELEKAGNP